MEEKRFKEQHGLRSITSELIMSASDETDFSKIQILNLQLKFTKIQKIENLSDLHNLRILNLRGNAITRIQNLGALSQMTELNLSENKIRVIENLNGLGQLEVLNLFSNLIKDIPKGSIDCLRNLKTLNIGNNRIVAASELGNLSVLQKLQNLTISGNTAAQTEECYDILVYRLPRLQRINEEFVDANCRSTAKMRFDVGQPRIRSRSRSQTPSQKDTKIVLEKYINKRERIANDKNAIEVQWIRIKQEISEAEIELQRIESEVARVTGKIHQKKLDQNTDEKALNRERDKIEQIQLQKEEIENIILELQADLEKQQEHSSILDQSEIDFEEMAVSFKKNNQQSEEEVEAQLKIIEQDVESNIAEMQFSKEQVLALEAKISESKETIELLEQKERQQEAIFANSENLRSEIRALEGRTLNFSEHINQVNDHISEKEAGIAKIQDTLNESLTDKHITQDDKSLLQRRLTDACDELEALKNQTRDFEAHKNRLDQIFESLEVLDKEIDGKVEASDWMEKLIPMRKEMLATGQNEINRRHRHIRKLQETQRHNRTTFNAQAADVFRADQELLFEEENAKVRLVQIHDGIEKEKVNLEQVFVDLQDKSNEICHMDADIDAVQHNIESKKQQLVTATADVKAKEGTRDSITDQMMTFDENLSGKRDVLAKVVNYLHDLENQTKYKSEAYYEIRGQFEQCAASVRLIQQELHQKQDSHEEIHTQFEDCNDTYMSTKNDIECFIEDYEDKMTNLRTASIDAEQELIQKREVLGVLRRQLMDAEEDNKELRIKISEQHSAIGAQAHEEDRITEEMGEKQQRLFQIQTQVNHFDTELIAQKEVMSRLTEDLVRERTVVEQQGAELERVKRTVAHKEEIKDLVEIEYQEREKQLQSVKNQLEEQKRNYIQQKNLHKDKILKLSNEIKAQKDHNSNIKLTLDKVRDQKTSILGEIDECAANMTEKERQEEDEIERIKASISHGHATVKALQNACAKEKRKQDRLIRDGAALHSTQGELQKKLNGVDSIKDDICSTLQVIENRVERLQPDAESANIVLSTGGYELNEAIEQKLIGLVSARHEIEFVDHEQALAAEELCLLQAALQSQHTDRHFQSSVLQTDRQTQEVAYLDKLRLENDNLKEYIRQREEYNKSHLQVAERQLNQKHADIDAKMMDLMASMNMTGSLPDIRATPSVKGSIPAGSTMTTPSVKMATPSVKGSTAENEIQSIYKSLNEGMDRLRDLGDLPRAVSPIMFRDLDCEDENQDPNL